MTHEAVAHSLLTPSKFGNCGIYLTLLGLLHESTPDQTSTHLVPFSPYRTLLQLEN